MREPRLRRHPTDLSDAEWAALEPLLPPPAPRGRPLKWPRRLMAEAIFYLVRSGCAWRMLPRRFPPWPTVFARFRRWRLDGTLRLLKGDFHPLFPSGGGRPRAQATLPTTKHRGRDRLGVRPLRGAAPPTPKGR